MIVKFGDNSVDLDTIVTVEDMLKLLAELPGQKAIAPKPRTTSKAKATEVLFDEQTEKEIALRNLYKALTEAHTKLRSDMFPVAIGNLMHYAQDAGKKDLVNIPPVDTERFADLQKLSYLSQMTSSYMNTLTQTRIGFGLALTITEDGKIYAVKDLRELYKKF